MKRRVLYERSKPSREAIVLSIDRVLDVFTMGLFIGLIMQFWLASPTLRTTNLKRVEFALAGIAGVASMVAAATIAFMVAPKDLVMPQILLAMEINIVGMLIGMLLLLWRQRQIHEERMRRDP
jgi:hypothetical protein